MVPLSDLVGSSKYKTLKHWMEEVEDDGKYFTIYESGRVELRASYTGCPAAVPPTPPSQNKTREQCSKS